MNNNKNEKINTHLNKFRKQEKNLKEMFLNYKKEQASPNLTEKDTRILELFQNYERRKSLINHEIADKIYNKNSYVENKLEKIKEEIQLKQQLDKAKKEQIISQGIMELNKQRESMLKFMQEDLSNLKVQSEELSELLDVYRKSKIARPINDEELNFLLDMVSKIKKLRSMTYYTKFDKIENFNRLVDLSKNFHELGSLMEDKVDKLYSLVSQYVKGFSDDNDIIKLRLEKEISDIIKDLILKIKEKPTLNEIAAYSTGFEETSRFASMEGQEGFGSGQEFNQEDIDKMFGN